MSDQSFLPQVQKPSVHKSKNHPKTISGGTTNVIHHPMHHMMDGSLTLRIIPTPVFSKYLPQFSPKKYDSIFILHHFARPFQKCNQFHIIAMATTQTEQIRSWGQLRLVLQIGWSTTFRTSISLLAWPFFTQNGWICAHFGTPIQPYKNNDIIYSGTCQNWSFWWRTPSSIGTTYRSKYLKPYH